MKPMLAKTYGPKFSRFPCFVQPKLNGVRCLYQNGVFQSREEKFWHLPVLQHLQDELLHLPLPIDCLLDGELYVHGWSLQKINGAVAVKRKEPDPLTLQVEYHVFDRVLENTPFSERFLHTAHTIISKGLPHIHAVETSLAHNRSALDALFGLYCANSYEGIMLRPDGPYEYGERFSERVSKMTEFRSSFLYKHKSWLDAEFLCVGWTHGLGKHEGRLGALVCQTSDGKQFNVGTGFDDETRISFAANPPVGSQIKVRFNWLTTDGIPAPAPSFLCVM